MVLAGVKNPASLIYVYAFFIDNIATAFAACALYEVFPISTTAIFSFSTLVWLVSYDLLVTAFCLTITWAAFSYWARVRAQNAGNARRALKREHFCKLLAFSSTVVMATAHKSITLFGWQGIELVVNARLHYEPAAHDEDDLDDEIARADCTIENSTAMICSCLAYALLTSLVFLSVSLAIRDVASPACATRLSAVQRYLLTLLSESYGIALGWNLFNISDIIYECKLPHLYYSFAGEILRSAVVTILCCLAFVYVVNRPRGGCAAGGATDGGGADGARPRSCCRTARRVSEQFCHFGGTVVYLLTSLTFVYVYYVPIATRFSNLAASAILASIAVALTLMTIVSAGRVGWHHCSGDESSVVKFFSSSASWAVMCDSWWWCARASRGFQAEGLSLFLCVKVHVVVRVRARARALARRQLDLRHDRGRRRAHRRGAHRGARRRAAVLVALRRVDLEPDRERRRCRGRRSGHLTPPAQRGAPYAPVLRAGNGRGRGRQRGAALDEGR